MDTRLCRVFADGDTLIGGDGDMGNFDKWWVEYNRGIWMDEYVRIKRKQAAHAAWVASKEITKDMCGVCPNCGGELSCTACEYSILCTPPTFNP